MRHLAGGMATAGAGLLGIMVEASGAWCFVAPMVGRRCG